MKFLSTISLKFLLSHLASAVILVFSCLTLLSSRLFLKQFQFEAFLMHLINPFAPSWIQFLPISTTAHYLELIERNISYELREAWFFCLFCFCVALLSYFGERISPTAFSQWLFWHTAKMLHVNWYKQPMKIFYACIWWFSRVVLLFVVNSYKLITTFTCLCCEKY